MKTTLNSIGTQSPSSRTFTFSQLSKISDDNYGILNQCIDMSRFHSDDIFVLKPIIIHEHAFGIHVKPHFRALVTKLYELEVLALQDITLEQWEEGSEIDNLQILGGDFDLPF